MLRPAFQLAEEDDLIRRNPFNFELATVHVNDSIAREALSPQDERRFLDFIKGDKHYSRYYEGHSDISVTYNTYTHLGFEDVRGDMLRMTDGAV